MKKRTLFKNFLKSVIFFIGLTMVGLGLILADLMHEQRDSDAANTGFTLFPELKGKV